MTLLATINANGTTVLMATHDSTIVDQMKRRVVELVSGHVVRDERSGGYQTKAVPVHEFAIDDSLAPRGPSAATGLMPTVPTDPEADSGVRAVLPPPAPNPEPHPPEPAEPAASAAPAPSTIPEPRAAPAATPIATRPATPRPAPAAQPARRPAHAPDSAPPPLVDPLDAERERGA